MLNAMDTSSIIAIAIDAALVLFLVIFFFVGIKKGFVKMCKGFIASVLVLVVAGFAAAPLAKLVINNTSWDESLATSITTPMSESLPNPYAQIYYYDLDGDPDTAEELVFDAGEGEKPYDEIFGGTVYGTLGLQKLMKPLIERTITEDTPTVFLIDALGQSIVYVIYLVIMFIVVAILARIIVSIIFLLLRKVVTNLYVVYFLDKFLGGVFGLVTGAFAILCILAVFQFMANLDFMSSVNTALENTYIAKFAMDYNFIYTFLSSNINFSNLLGS